MKQLKALRFFMLSALLTPFLSNAIDLSTLDSEQAKRAASIQRLSSNEQATIAPKAQTSTPSNNHEFQSLAFGNSRNSNSDSEHLVRLNSEKGYGGLQSESLPVFGHSLFEQQCETLKQAHFFNPDYQLSVGDKISLQIWGAIESNTLLSIDNQGNLFLPEVGPVHLEGVKNRDLNQILARRLKDVFKKDVFLYANLLTAQPVQVYVSGFVKSPGLYDGLSSDSIIYYLCRAGGISLEEGSFRQIEILRDNKPIQRVDLYNFLLKGNIKHFQLHQGDTIVVKKIANLLNVSGNVKKPYQYEFLQEPIALKTLTKTLPMNASTTFVRLEHHRGEQPEVRYLPIKDSLNEPLYSGDSISFVSDQTLKQVIVFVEGAVSDQHQFVMKEGESLKELVSRIHFKPKANVNNLQLYRGSVAKEQEAAIQSSLSRLERQILTNSSVTENGAKMQVVQAEMIMRFIDEAKNVKLKGQVVLGSKETWSDILLENNDVIQVPEQSEIVTISGDVLNSMSIERKPNYAVNNYVGLAGGFTNTADRKKALVVKQNGQVEIVNPSAHQAKIMGGDQIIILSKPQTESWQITESLSKIIYQIAVAARVALVV